MTREQKLKALRTFWWQEVRKRLPDQKDKAAWLRLGSDFVERKVSNAELEDDPFTGYPTLKDMEASER